jgi:hypothetical protein
MPDGQNAVPGGEVCQFGAGMQIQRLHHLVLAKLNRVAI